MKFINGSLSKQEIIKHSTDGNKRHQCIHEILLDAPGLNCAQLAAKPICDICCAITKESIDHRQVKILANGGANSVSDRVKDMQGAIDQALIHPFVDEGFCKPIGRFDK